MECGRNDDFGDRATVILNLVLPLFQHTETIQSMGTKLEHLLWVVRQTVWKTVKLVFRCYLLEDGSLGQFWWFALGDNGPGPRDSDDENLHQYRIYNFVEEGGI